MNRPLAFIFGLCFYTAQAQQSTVGYVADTAFGQFRNTQANDTTTAHKKARNIRLLAAGHVAAYGATFYYLNKAWYKNYPRSPFQVFDDSREWLQVDKVGHAWSAYQLSRAGAALWRSASVNTKKNTADWLGAGSAFIFQTGIELMDAHSAAWGWSWADIAANFSGTSLYLAQQLGWQEQKLSFKFSSFPKNYEDQLLQQRANDLYGTTYPEKILKDYNAQTYWLSVNLRSMGIGKNLPPWLNIAAGYGASGLWGGFNNTAKDKNGTVTFNRIDIPRRREWYLSPDIDFTRIKTNKRWLRTLLFTANAIKCPAPAMLYSGGKLKIKALAF